MNFIGNSNRFAVFDSPYMSQHRIYLVDTDAKKVMWLNFLRKEGKENEF